LKGRGNDPGTTGWGWAREEGPARSGGALADSGKVKAPALASKSPLMRILTDTVYLCKGKFDWEVAGVTMD